MSILTIYIPVSSQTVKESTGKLGLGTAAAYGIGSKQYRPGYI